MENITTKQQDFQNKLRPGYFFLSLGVLVTLLVSTIAFIHLVFATLEKAFPDVLNAVYQYGYYSDNFNQIRVALSTVIIFFPLYIILSFYWRKNSNITLSQVEIVIRKWMVYLILFLVTLISAIDLVILIRYFVSGEITIRFIFKVLTIFIVCGLLFWYYFMELRRSLNSIYKKKIYFTIIATLLVLSGVVYSFSILGSPKTQRDLRMDQRRVDDLQNIQNQIINYWQQKSKLPETLADLADPLQSYQNLPVDPEFAKGAQYEYQKIDTNNFELCAMFKKPIPSEWQEGNTYGGVFIDKNISSTAPYGGLQNESWKHEVGRTCFKRKVDKERYPPINIENLNSQKTI